MADEIKYLHDDAAETLYAIVRHPTTGQFYAAATPEDFLVANWATYDIALAEENGAATGNGMYEGDMPAVAAGSYWVDIYVQAAGAPAQTDVLLDSTLYYWDATNLLPGGLDAILEDTATTIPALIGGIGTAGGAAISVDVNDDNYDGGIAGVTSGTTKVGEQTNTYASTSVDDGTAHIMTHAVQDVDIVYQFLGGGGTSPVQIFWKGILNPNNDTLTFSAWNHVSPGWEVVGTQTGQSSTTSWVVKNIVLYARHMGTSAAELGKVYLRLNSVEAYNHVVRTDQTYLDYSVTSRTVGYANGAVWVDTVNGTAGTESYVNGTADNPVLTWADALTIAAAVGLERFEIINGSTITLNANSDNYTLTGDAWTLALGTQSCSGISVHGADVTGVCTGATAPHFHHCVFGATTTLPPSYLTDCGFNGTLTFGSAGEFTFDTCHSMVGGTSTPIFDFGSGLTASEVNMRRYSGGVEIRNMGAGSGSYNMSLEGHGQLVIASTCSPTSTIAIRGHFTVTDNVAGGFVTGGGVISDEARFDVTQITGGAYPISTDASGRVDVGEWLGTTVATPTTAGVPEVDVTYVMGTILSEGAAGRLAGGIVKFFNVASPTATCLSLPDAVPGAAGGLFIAGQNAATGITTALTANITGSITGSLSGTVGGVANDGLSAASIAADAIAEIAAGIWQDTTSAHFTTASSIGKSLFTAGAVPGAAGGLFIAGTNAATIITTSLTTHFVGTVDTVTTYTGNTKQTADNNTILAHGTYGLSALKTQGDSAWITATGFSTHTAANVVTALGTGSTLTACATATGFATPTNITAGTITTVTTLTGHTPQTADNNTILAHATYGMSALKTLLDTTGIKVLSIANDAITAASINTGAFSADAFAADAIVAATFATGAFTADAFAADALIAATFATDCISADALKTDAITEIQSGLAKTGADGDTLETLSDQLDVTAGGAGAVTEAITIYADDGSTPLDGAEVWITNDVDGVDGESVIAGTLFTNTNGVVTFNLDIGDYWLHVQAGRYNFTTTYPRKMTVAAGGFSWS